MVSESLFEMDMENKAVQRTFGRERQHRENLDALGLDEVGALEYVLMLSRDEAVAGGGGETSETKSRTPSPPSRNGIPMPIVRPTKSNEKVQVSPRDRPEPRQAGMGDSQSSPGTSSSDWKLVSDDEFPTVSSSASPPRATPPPGGLSAWTSPLAKINTTGAGDGRVIRSRSGKEQEEEDLRLAIKLSGSSPSSGPEPSSNARASSSSSSAWDPSVPIVWKKLSRDDPFPSVSSVSPPRAHIDGRSAWSSPLTKITATGTGEGGVSVGGGSGGGSTMNRSAKEQEEEDLRVAIKLSSGGSSSRPQKSSGPWASPRTRTPSTPSA
jgi:hypothetical protein